MPSKKTIRKTIRKTIAKSAKKTAKQTDTLQPFNEYRTEVEK